MAIFRELLATVLIIGYTLAVIWMLSGGGDKKDGRD